MRVAWNLTHLSTINVTDMDDAVVRSFTDCDELNVNEHGVLSFVERGDTPEEDTYHIIMADLVSITRGPRKAAR